MKWLVDRDAVSRPHNRGAGGTCCCRGRTVAFLCYFGWRSWRFQYGWRHPGSRSRGLLINYSSNFGMADVHFDIVSQWLTGSMWPCHSTPDERLNARTNGGCLCCVWKSVSAPPKMISVSVGVGTDTRGGWLAARSSNFSANLNWSQLASAMPSGGLRGVLCWDTAIPAHPALTETAISGVHRSARVCMHTPPRPMMALLRLLHVARHQTPSGATKGEWRFVVVTLGALSSLVCARRGNEISWRIAPPIFARPWATSMASTSRTLLSAPRQRRRRAVLGPAAGEQSSVRRQSDICGRATTLLRRTWPCGEWPERPRTLSAATAVTCTPHTSVDLPRKSRAIFRITAFVEVARAHT